MFNRAFRSLCSFAQNVKLLGLFAAIQGARATYGRGLLRVSAKGADDVIIRRRNSDYATLRQIFGDREYDFGNPIVQNALERRHSEILKNGSIPLIVDAGANIGLATRWFKSRYPQAAIVAIEPDPDNFRILQENIIANDTTILLKAAVGSSTGKVSLSNGSAGWAVQTTRVNEGDGTEIVTLNSALDLIPNTVPWLFKIDIEGFEDDLFASNLQWLDQASAVFIEPHDWLDPTRNSSHTFQNAFGQRFFNLYVRGENLLFVRTSETAEPVAPREKRHIAPALSDGGEIDAGAARAAKMPASHI